MQALLLSKRWTEMQVDTFIIKITRIKIMRRTKKTEDWELMEDLEEKEDLESSCLTVQAIKRRTRTLAERKERLIKEASESRKRRMSPRDNSTTQWGNSLNREKGLRSLPSITTSSQRSNTKSTSTKKCTSRNKRTNRSNNQSSKNLRYMWQRKTPILGSNMSSPINPPTALEGVAPRWGEEATLLWRTKLKRITITQQQLLRINSSLTTSTTEWVMLSMTRHRRISSRWEILKVSGLQASRTLIILITGALDRTSITNKGAEESTTLMEVLQEEALKETQPTSHLA